MTGAGKGSSASSIPRLINSIFSLLGLKIQSSQKLRCCHTSSIRIKYFYVIIIDEKYCSHSFFVFKAIKLQVNVSEDCSCPGNYNEAPPPKSIPSYGCWCWLSCLPGKFRSITLKLNSNTESACLSSGPGASQHSINLTFNRPQNSYKQFKQTSISTPGSFWQPHVKVCLILMFI